MLIIWEKRPSPTLLQRGPCYLSFQENGESDNSPLIVFVSRLENPASSASPHRTYSANIFAAALPILDMIQHLNIFLLVSGPELITGFKVRPHHGQVQGDEPFCDPAGHTIYDSQDALGILGQLGTCWLMFSWF